MENEKTTILNQLTHDIYNDGLKESVQETGKIFRRIPKAINAALSSVDVWIEERNYRVDETKKILADKLDKIDPDKITQPETYIAIPTIQAISYSMDSSELRELYANLLASSMNTDTKDLVHPSYIEIIKQLSPYEANFLNILKTKSLDQYPIIRSVMKLKVNDISGNDIINKSLDIVTADVIKLLLPSYFNIKLEEYNAFLIAIDNLIRLNLIEIDFNNIIPLTNSYDDVLSNILFYELTKKFPILNDTNHRITKGILKVTKLGKSFLDICVD